MSDGGKGSSRRPNKVPDVVVADNWSNIFGESPLERKKRLEREDNTGTSKDEYYDVLSTEDCFEVNSPDPAERDWYYDSHGVKRKK